MNEPSERIVQRTKKLGKQFFNLSPEEQYKQVTEMLRDLSPNDQVRNREE